MKFYQIKKRPGPIKYTKDLTISNVLGHKIESTVLDESPQIWLWSNVLPKLNLTTFSNQIEMFINNRNWLNF